MVVSNMSVCPGQVADERAATLARPECRPCRNHPASLRTMIARREPSVGIESVLHTVRLIGENPAPLPHPTGVLRRSRRSTETHATMNLLLTISRAIDALNERIGRAGSVARPGDGAGELRQRHLPLPAQPELERLPRAAVVPVRHGVPALLGLHAAAQRAHPHRRRVVAAVSPRTRMWIDIFGTVFFLLPVYALHHVAVVADVHERVDQRRDLQQRRRPDPLAGAAAGPARASFCSPCRASRS